MQRNLKRQVKCPHCGCPELKFTEHEPGRLHTYEQIPGPVIRHVESREDARGERYVVGSCLSCNHAWKVRGVERVTQFAYARVEGSEAPQDAPASLTGTDGAGRV